MDCFLGPPPARRGTGGSRHYSSRSDLKKMLFDERPARAGFEILFKLKGFVFVLKCRVRNQCDWSPILSCRNVPVFMPLDSFFQIVGAASIWFAVAAIEKIDVVHTALPAVANSCGPRPPKPAMAGEGGDDVPKFEPTCPEQSRRETWLKFKAIDKSIQKLRAIYKVHPEWFEAPKSRSNKGKNELEYSS